MPAARACCASCSAATTPAPASWPGPPASAPPPPAATSPSCSTPACWPASSAGGTATTGWPMPTWRMRWRRWPWSPNAARTNVPGRARHARGCAMRVAAMATWPASSAWPCCRACSTSNGWWPRTTAALSSPNAGVEALRALGLDGDAWQRQSRSGGRGVAYGCLDWSERRDHLAGKLAGALLKHFLDQGWLRRQAGDRALQVTPCGAPGTGAVGAVGAFSVIGALQRRTRPASAPTIGGQRPIRSARRGGPGSAARHTARARTRPGD